MRDLVLWLQEKSAAFTGSADAWDDEEQSDDIAPVYARAPDQDNPYLPDDLPWWQLAALQTVLFALLTGVPSAVYWLFARLLDSLAGGG